jgi:hypothetical protein
VLVVEPPAWVVPVEPPAWVVAADPPGCVVAEESLDWVAPAELPISVVACELLEEGLESAGEGADTVVCPGMSVVASADAPGTVVCPSCWVVREFGSSEESEVK